MKTIVIKTQKELDKLPNSFKEFTTIEIRSDKNIVIHLRKLYDSSQVIACGSSQVTAHGSSQVTVHDSSQVTAYDSSQVTAFTSSKVTAFNSSKVIAYESSQVTAYDSSQVDAYDLGQVIACDSSLIRAFGSSQVTAYDSSQVIAYESSQVTAHGSSQVIACGSSQVIAYGNSIVMVLSALVVLKKIKHYSVIILERVTVKLPKKDKTTTVIKRKIFLHDIKSFIDFYDLKVKNNSIILYKSVNPETLCDFYTGKIKYQGIVECPDFDLSKDKECGGGLHLCATPELTQTFNVGKILRCEVALKDIVIYGKDIAKVRCKKVKVLGEV